MSRQKEIFQQLRKRKPTGDGSDLYTGVVLVLVGIAVILFAMFSGSHVGMRFLIGVVGFFVIIMGSWVLTSGSAEDELEVDPQVEQKKKNARNFMNELARQAKVEPIEDETGMPGFTKTIGGHPVSFEGSSNNLIVTCALPLGSFRLYVYPERQVRASGFRKMVDVQVGDRTFDRVFLVQTNDSKRARGVLAPAIRGKLLELSQLVQDRPFSVALNGGEIKLFFPIPHGAEKSSWLGREDDLLVEFQRSLGIWMEAAIVDFVPNSGPKKEACCLVCGDFDIRPCALQQLPDSSSPGMLGIHRDLLSIWLWLEAI